MLLCGQRKKKDSGGVKRRKMAEGEFLVWNRENEFQENSGKEPALLMRNEKICVYPKKFKIKIKLL